MAFEFEGAELDELDEFDVGWLIQLFNTVALEING